MKLINLLICVSLLLTACGPETIFLRPGLDTPTHHAANGRKLLERGKIDSAQREFERAKELDPGYAPAYVGLGLVSGHLGDFVAGRRHMDTANKLAATAEEKKGVEEGIRLLEEMEKGKAP